LKVKVEVGLKFEITFLTQYLSLSIFYPNLGSNNPALFRVYKRSGQSVVFERTQFDSPFSSVGKRFQALVPCIEKADCPNEVLHEHFGI